MKKLVIFIIMFSLNSFSQNEFKNFDNLKSFFQAAEVEENHVFIDRIIEKLNLQIFEEIKTSENLKKHSTAEAKFSLNHQVNSVFKERIQNNLEYEKSDIKESLLIEMNTNFVENVIVKLFLVGNSIEEIDFNSTKNYGDRNIEFYRNYIDLKNKLLISYNLDGNIELQIGNSLYPYLNKIFKTDVEKTLNTSLNLLAINF